MADYKEVVKKEFKVKLGALIDDIKARRNKEFFQYTGTQIYIGRQGSGKTISAVKHTLFLKRKYPKAILVSNLVLSVYQPISYKTYKQKGIDPTKEYIYFQGAEQLAKVLVGVNNEFKGVIYLIDEIHTYFNAVDSKNIEMFVFTEISQQRKQRKCVIGTSQLFMRLAKPWREQCFNMLNCKTIGGVLTIVKTYDGETVEQDYSGKLTGTLKRIGFFWHDRELRSAYDTYQKVVSTHTEFDMPTQLVMDKNIKKSLSRYQTSQFKTA